VLLGAVEAFHEVLVELLLVILAHKDVAVVTPVQEQVEDFLDGAVAEALVEGLVAFPSESHQIVGVGTPTSALWAYVVPRDGASNPLLLLALDVVLTRLAHSLLLSSVRSTSRSGGRDGRPTSTDGSRRSPPLPYASGSSLSCRPQVGR
jgi:hypothetical protein